MEISLGSNDNLPLVIVVTCVLLFVLILLNHKYKISIVWIETIKKFAPLWLTFFPAVVTYFFTCGLLSALFAIIYSTISNKEFNSEEYLLMEKAVEYVCGFFMPLIYFKILTKNKFPFFWSIIITIVHMLTAGYRDAKFITLESNNNEVAKFESGPTILANIQFTDALIPLISFLVFYLILKKSAQPSQPSQP